MILNNNNYLINISKHRKFFFLLSKKVYKTTKIENSNNFHNIFEQIILKNKKSHKKDYYPLINDPLESLVKSKKIISNLEKTNNFLDSIKLLNQNKILENIEVLSKILQYRHILKFTIEFFIFLIFIICIFKKGTFY